MNEKQDYESELERGVSKIFKKEDLTIGRIGNPERWYKSEDGKDTYDGDSLCGRIKESKFRIVDGKNIDEVGIFNIYENTFRNIKIGENEGYMLAYLKIRELAGESHNPSRKNYSIKLLIADKETEEFQTHELMNKKLDDFITMATFPEVNVNDVESTISVTAKIVEPKSMSFEPDPRSEIINYASNLNDFKIEIIQEENNNLNPDSVKNYVSSIAPKLGCDNTYNPVFPDTRKDVCGVRHLAENGTSYGYDTIYLAWKPKGDMMKVREIDNSKSDQGYLHIRSIKEDTDNIILEYSSGTYTKSKKELGLE